MELPNHKGLSDLFQDPTQLPHVIQTWDNLPISIITSGPIPPNPAELLDSKGMERIIDELKRSYDLVIMDSPPAVVVDPIVLSAKVDSVVVVIEPEKTRIDAAQVVLEQLDRAGARVIGVVMNPISRKNSHYYTRYKDFSIYQDSQSYGSNYSEDSPPTEAKNKAL
jgi:capsular exopolysaccharide synthesis family protein